MFSLIIILPWPELFHVILFSYLTLSVTFVQYIYVLSMYHCLCIITNNHGLEFVKSLKRYPRQTYIIRLLTQKGLPQHNEISDLVERAIFTAKQFQFIYRLQSLVGCPFSLNYFTFLFKGQLKLKPTSGCLIFSLSVEEP